MDPDGDAVTVSIIGPAAAHGSASLSGNTITFTPTFGYIGNDTITYKLCDSGSPTYCDTAIYIITVTAGPPVAMRDTISVNSGSFVKVKVQANDTLSVSTFSYTTSLMPSILSASNGTAVVVNDSIRYTPNAGFTGVDSLVYQICDNNSPQACDTAFMYITVLNQNPVANADAGTTSACNAIIINAVANDTDPEGGVLTITSVSSPSNGTAIISNNEIVYTPSSSPVFIGVDNFTYQVCDNGTTQKCVTGNVSITVNGVYPPSTPPVLGIDSDSTFVNQTLYMIVIANDSDPDLDSIQVDSTATGLLAPTIGYITYLPNNQVVYHPNLNVMGRDSFEYQVCDIHHLGTGCVNIVSSCTQVRA